MFVTRSKRMSKIFLFVILVTIAGKSLAASKVNVYNRFVTEYVKIKTF